MFTSPYIPAPPLSPEPPPALVQVVNCLKNRLHYQVGLTTTPEGEWALLVRVKLATTIPLAEVESLRGNFPVIYELDSETIPEARPAYPQLGE
jgi:hypothetical protein